MTELHPAGRTCIDCREPMFVASHDVNRRADFQTLKTETGSIDCVATGTAHRAEAGR